MAARTMFTIFHALKPPAISVHKYLQRIFQYANCSRSCFVVALIYIDRIIQRNANFMITSLNIHRLLITRCAGDRTGRQRACSSSMLLRLC
eukprot:SAG31_NODE_2230_length_6144_cov_3.629115_8_plen_91_part_00